jgi:hypothetical protein
MPISPVIANTIEVRLLGVVANAGAINVLHAIATGGITVNQALANTLGAAIKSAWTANMAPLCASANLTRVGIRDLRTANQAEYLDVGALVPASGVGDALPGQIAVCVTLRTAQAGKSFRGRVYLGGWSEAENDTTGNTVQAASTAAVNFISAVSSAMTASGLTLAVASRPAERYTVVKTTFHNDGTTTLRTITQGPARAGGSVPVTVVQSRNNGWETQRRRNNGRGASPSLLTPAAEIHL